MALLSSKRVQTTTNKSIVLKISNLTKTFFLHERGVLVPAGQDVNLNVYKGRLTALTGPNGAGKSSLMKCVYRTYLTCDGIIDYKTRAGEIIDLARATEDEILELRRHSCIFCPEKARWMWWPNPLSIWERIVILRGRQQQICLQGSICRSSCGPTHRQHFPVVKGSE